MANSDNEEGSVEKVSKLSPTEEFKEGMIGIKTTRNDGSVESLIDLSNLKIIFQAQLPKMPAEYIARYIYDPDHESLYIQRKCGEVIGGVTYKVFYEQSLTELVFCAISSKSQVHGYGSFLMVRFKEYLKKKHKAINILTYADNYAIGYFQKYGFTKTITLNPNIWRGRIKDYDGGTLMQCKLNHKLDYVSLQSNLKDQSEYLKEIIRKVYPDHEKEYPGLDPNKFPYKLADIPGLRNYVDCPEELESKVIPKGNGLDSLLRFLLMNLQSHTSSWPFREPVRFEDVPDYLTIIKNPMDLSTVDDKLTKHQYDSLEGFSSDIFLIFNNCRIYNSQKTPYYKCANTLEDYYRSLLREKEL